MAKREAWQVGGSAAELYQRYLVPLIASLWAADLISRAAPHPGERVLDVACGTGVVARLAAERMGSGRVVGLDINAGMLAVARSLPTAAVGLIEWQEGSALALPFPDCLERARRRPGPPSRRGRVANEAFRACAKTGGNVMAEPNIQYDWSDADAYEAFMGRWSELLAPIFIDFTGIAPGARVLDVACGTGVLSKALAEVGANVIGVDASAGYLAGARSHRAHPKITYEEGDIRRMRFTDNSFDAAVSTLALDVLPEIEQVVSEMNRVTRPGGIVASAVPQFLGGMAAFDLVMNTAAVLDASIREARDARAGRQQFWPDGQAALWRKMGLVDVAEIPVVIDCEYRSFDDYWATFTSGLGIVPRYLMALPDDLRTTVQEHVRGGYLLGWPDGPRSFPMMFRAVRGIVPN